MRTEGSVAAGGLRLGTLLGSYRLCLELAGGGMSTVYLARVQEGVGAHRFVAVKCLRPHLAADPEVVDMFLDEAWISSWIHHPNVCEVLDCRRHEGATFLVMEYLQGQSLAAIRRTLTAQADDSLPAQFAGIVARMIADAAEGLHAAHELTTAGGEPVCVVHRDISPENVFVTYDGNVKIMDFGIAATAQRRHLTQPGTIKGKYGYIPPEVLAGQKATRRSDVWSLGVVAWEMLVGRRLFEGNTDVDVLRAVTDGTIPPPSEARPGLPVDLDDVVMQALERDPAKRYATARELGRKLGCFLAEQRLAIGLAELAEFMDRTYPNGRACARQLLDTVERMDDVSSSGSLTIDHDDRPTVAAQAPAEVADVEPPAPRALGSERIVAVPPVSAPPPAKPERRWAWPLASSMTAVAIVVAGLWLQGCPREASAPPAAKAAEGGAPAETLATPTRAECAPGGEITLEAVLLPTGEVVYRLQPI